MRDYSDKWNNMILHRSGLSDSQLKHFEFEIDFLEIEKMIKSEFVYFDNSYDSHSSCNIEKESKCGDHLLDLMKYDYRITFRKNNKSCIISVNIDDEKFGNIHIVFIEDKVIVNRIIKGVSLFNIFNRIEYLSFLLLEEIDSNKYGIAKKGIKPKLVIFPLYGACPVCMKGKIELNSVISLIRCRICGSLIKSNRQGKAIIIWRKNLTTAST